MKNKKGFTLMEILIAGFLFSIFMISTMGLLSSGINVWRRLGIRDHGEIKLRLNLEKMEREVRNMIHFKKILIETEKDRFTFPTVFPRGGSSTPDIAKVSYFYDSSSNAFCRSQKLYRESERRDPEVCQVLIPNVSSVSFEYAILDEGGEFLMEDEIEDKDKFLGVSMKISLSKGTKKNITKTIAIPGV